MGAGADAGIIVAMRRRSWMMLGPGAAAVPVLGGGAGATHADGVHWQLENLAVHDGSLFPTSVGANPKLSVYGIANRLAQGLARRLTDRDIPLD